MGRICSGKGVCWEGEGREGERDGVRPQRALTNHGKYQGLVHDLP